MPAHLCNQWPCIVCGATAPTVQAPVPTEMRGCTFAHEQRLIARAKSEERARIIALLKEMHADGTIFIHTALRVLEKESSNEDLS